MSTSTPALDRTVLRHIGPQPERYCAGTYWNATVVRFDGAVYVISRRAILTLVTIAGCNANCRFCSNEITFTPGGRFLRFDERVSRAIELARLASIDKIAYTGGEPTVAPASLLALVAATAPRFRTARLHTNGVGLLRATGAGEAPLVDALIDAGLTGVSVSVAHFDRARNAEIMRFKTAWTGLTDDDLRAIAARNERPSFSARLSCVLCAGAVDDLDGVLQYVAWGGALGFRSFIFRATAGIPDAYAKATPHAHYNAGTHTGIDELTEALERRPGWCQVFAEHKSDSHVHVLRHAQLGQVVLDESSEEPDPDDKVRRLTMMPNGVLYTSWIDARSNVFADDEERTLRDAARELGRVRGGASGAAQR
jgi:molybdenum cofactor biosynthesis enzyme MoaA